ncbi:MAG: hypothetical protein EA352_10455 [Gemmatimonadales bacterium]|nr:MAG: hypothetical protein EA352_10455 [Gemmatimonadales bacterium]
MLGLMWTSLPGVDRMEVGGPRSGRAPAAGWELGTTGSVGQGHPLRDRAPKPGTQNGHRNRAPWRPAPARPMLVETVSPTPDSSMSRPDPLFGIRPLMAALLMALLVLTACGDAVPEDDLHQEDAGEADFDPDAFEDPDPLRIGATMSESGAFATQGSAAANGYRLCVSRLNEEGGILGRPVALGLEDDESDTERAVELYTRMLEGDEVDAVFGPYGSSLTAVVAPVTEVHRKVHVSPLAATSSIWEEGHEYLFMVLPPAELFLGGLVELAVEAGMERMAILREELIFPRAAADGAEELAREAGLEVVLHQGFEPGTTDFGPLAEAVGEADAQVLGVAASALDAFADIVRALDEAGVEVEMFGTSGAVDAFRDELGSRADGTFGLSAWEPGLPYPGVDEFVEDYEAAFGMAPSFHAAGAYGACRVFAQGAEQAGSLDPDAHRQALLELETTTIFGDWAVDERGFQTAHQGTTIQWQDGERVVVWPADVAAAEPRLPVVPED